MSPFRQLIIAAAGAAVLCFVLAGVSRAQQPESYTFRDLTSAEVDTIGHALADRPWKEVHALVAKLLAQVQEQKDASAKGGEGVLGAVPKPSTVPPPK